MLQCGQKVVYGIHGVCTIIDLETQVVNRKKVEYFVLEPLKQPGTRFYVPTQNLTALSKLKPLLSKDALDALLCSSVAYNASWIPDENQRKLRYRELINSGDRGALISMVRCLHQHKTQQLIAGRKFHLCDENFLKDAQTLLSDEFSLVLGIEPEQVAAYILEKTI